MELEFLLNIGVALFCGFAVGVERQINQHPAGVRTNTLVCLGAAFFVSMAPLTGHENEKSRLAAQIASGIGFLGGGGLHGVATSRP